MKHVLMAGEGKVEVAEAAEPELTDGRSAVISVEASAICGSDMHFYDGDLPVMSPFPVGHEAIGRVTSVGDRVERFRPGDRVMVSAVAGCGHCAGCATGDVVLCDDGVGIFGTGALGGGQATALAVPAADFQMHHVPAGIDDEAALLLTDNLSTGWIAARRAGFSPGATVAVFGLGAVGQCAVRSALTLGAARVLAVDPVEGRRERAASAGAEPIPASSVEAIMEATGGRGVDAAIDAVALDATMSTALAAVRPGGTVSVVGVHNISPFPLEATGALMRSVNLRFSMAPVHQVWTELVPLVAAGRIRTDGIFTDTYALDDAAAAYEKVAQRSADCIKVKFQ